MTDRALALAHFLLVGTVQRSAALPKQPTNLFALVSKDKPLATKIKLRESFLTKADGSGIVYGTLRSERRKHKQNSTFLCGKLAFAHISLQRSKGAGCPSSGMVYLLSYRFACNFH